MPVGVKGQYVLLRERRGREEERKGGGEERIRQTLMAQLHLHLEVVELLRHGCLGLCTHLLSGPLLDAIELLVDIHVDG
jgi:hypothetical protein